MTINWNDISLSKNDIYIDIFYIDIYREAETIYRKAGMIYRKAETIYRWQGTIFRKATRYLAEK